MRKQYSEKPPQSGQSGNAMIYILVAIALFGFLTLTLSRQGEQSDDQNLDDELLEFQVTQVMNYANSANSVIDQMLMSGSSAGDLSFVLPDSANYDVTPHIHKVYHPSGGGFEVKQADSKIFTGTDNDPDPGWYMGSFNNVEWTPSSANDVIITAHQISQEVCEAINEKIGAPVSPVPALGAGLLLADYLIDAYHHSGTNANLTTTECADCDEWPMLCVSNDAGDMWSYYMIIEAR